MMNNRILVTAVAFAREIFFEDSSDEENDTSSVLEKIENYAECTLPNMNDRQFKMHFRMSPSTFEALLNKMHFIQSQTYISAVGHPPITLEKATMILIWCLGNIESFRSVADRFGISKSTCWSVLYKSCRLLLKLNKHFNIICWPVGERAIKVIREFSIRKMPGVIGAIDGSHIRIIAPRENHNSYVNRKSYHSVLLQGVCDSKMLFTDVYAGEAGSIHDYTLLKRSDLYRRIMSNDVLFPDDSHLIGDLAYKLEENLMVGFKDYGNLTQRQKNFNLILSQTRAVIENAFGLLKGRFRRLKYLETIRLDLISLLIISACILHNICIRREDLLEEYINIAEENRMENEYNPRNLPDLENEEINRNAIIKRNNIVNSLPL